MKALKLLSGGAFVAAVLLGSIFLAFAFARPPHLTRAASDGDIEEVRHLMQSGHNVNQTSSVFGTDAFTNWTPLMWACWNGHAATATALLEADARTDLLDCYGRGPLTLVVQSSKFKLSAEKIAVLKRLLEKGNPLDFERSFFSAIQIREREVIQEFIEYGVDVNTKNQHGETALHHVVTYKPVEETIIRLLLENGADPDIRGASGHTARELAQRQGLDTSEY